MSENSPELSILIVSYNVSDYLDRCLASIKQFTSKLRFEVIVVDSGSEDDSVAMARRRHPWATVIDAQSNVGFTKGNNLALAAATGEYICYLNPDTELIEDVFTPCVDYLKSHRQVGVVAPQLLNTDRSIQNSIGRFTKLSSLLNEYVLRNKADRERLVYPTKPTVIDYGLGACLIVRDDLCRQIGGLDERYFANHEETDFCLQLRRLGFPTIYYPAVKLIHHGGKSSNSPERKERWQHENRKGQYLFFQKNFSRLTAQTAKLIILVAMISRLAVLLPLNAIRPRIDYAAKIRYFSQTVGWLLAH